MQSINLKVVSMTIIILALAVALSIVITVRNQRASLLTETQTNLTITSNMLNRVIRNIMLSGEAPIAQRTLEDIKGIDEFTELEIYRVDGNSAFSDDETIELVNEFVEARWFELTDRSEAKQISSDGFNTALSTNTPVAIESIENQTLDYYFPILNYAECRDCHGYGGFIRGVAHYQVSTAGIFDRIETARNTLTLFFIGTGLVLAAAIVLTMRRIVVAPILSIGSTVTAVGSGDLDKRVTLEKRDELGRLATEINEMIVGLQEKSRLEIENSVIEARNDENRKYLDNISEGLLLVDRDQFISDQYSTYLETLFGTNEIAGRSLGDFVFPSDSESEARKELTQLIDLIFNNIQTDMDMIMSINPLSNRTIAVNRGGSIEEIVIDAQFQRIVTDGEVSNVMIIFENKTALVRAEQELESERRRSETEIEHIQAILRIGPDSFIEFAEEAIGVVTQLDDSAERIGDNKVVTELFRELHSLKGAARYMELKNFGAALHKTENLFAELRDGQREPDSDTTREIRNHLEELYSEIESIKQINDRFKQFAAKDGLQNLFAGSVRGFFENMQRMADDISATLEKEIRFITQTDFDSLPVLKNMRDPIIHLVRNAIDHGIEPSIERISNGKPEAGIVELRVRDVGNGNCSVEIRDDGGGIDYDAVRSKAIDLGLVSPNAASEKKLLRLLFMPAFSSRDEASEFSGRGVGLDAVHDAVKRLGGSVAVATTRGVGTKIALTVPIGEADTDDDAQPTAPGDSK